MHLPQFRGGEAPARESLSCVLQRVSGPISNGENMDALSLAYFAIYVARCICLIEIGGGK